MMRGQNRGMRRSMNKMGMDMNEMQDVQEVIIRTSKKEIIINKPNVTEMKAKESMIFMIDASDYEERELEAPAFSEDDIQMVIQQTGADEAKAISALTDADGNIAQAILLLSAG